ncbi:MAG TPA: type II toxin-antitoxin system CcdA family antitoxin [Thermoanaerobaculia bacterium]|nr:type II toxin-antitoxin system CcdA family antitoxin [Thermoanaerobaculia bacterium]
MEANQRAANVKTELVEKAREAHRRQREAWLEENREAIEAYNEIVVQRCVFSTDLRGF